MEPRAIGIEGLEVVGTGQVCPSRDDAEARRLWTEVAKLYSADTGLRALSGTVLVGRGRVAEDALRRVDDSALVLRFFGHQAGTYHGRDGARHYPELEVWHAYHFAEPSFGELHDLEVTRSGDGEATLIFCPNETGRGPAIRGTLTLVPGERFVSADWRFQTTDPDDGAGGHVDFGSYRDLPGQKPHLVGVRGIFFRHGENEPPFPDLPRDYYREVSVLETWTLHATSKIPCQPTGGTVFHDPSSRRPRDVAFVQCVTAQRPAVREP